jgi:hypothetical protein
MRAKEWASWFFWHEVSRKPLVLPRAGRCSLSVGAKARLVKEEHDLAAVVEGDVRMLRFGVKLRLDGSNSMLW